MVLDDTERQRRRALVAPMEAKVLELLDARPKHFRGSAKEPLPAFVKLSELPALYSESYGSEIDIQALSQCVGLTRTAELADLLRGTYFPRLAVRGSAKKGGVVVCRATENPNELLHQVQDHILELLRQAANPTTESNRPKRHSLDAGSLPKLYYAHVKKPLNFREFGCPSMRAFIERCDQLAVRQKGDKMHVVAKSDELRLSRKRTREEAPATGGAAAAAASATASGGDVTAGSGMDKERKKAKRAAKEAAAAVGEDANEKTTKAQKKKKKVSKAQKEDQEDEKEERKKRKKEKKAREKK
mmetsp:Transcript_25150/g.57259  ORF Transcript_25150/g.57259 Transcript_25150/m.57259 type:complete len:301 (-) Transcript_25150:403-1305(-)